MTTTDETTTTDGATTTTPTDDTAAPAGERDGAAQDQEQDRDQPEAVREARREAAGHRRKLRDAEGRLADAEAERDRLAGVVESYQRAEVEALAEGPRGLAAGADLWVAGTDLAGLLDDDGRADPAKVAAAVDQALTARPHWRRRSHGSADGGGRGTVTEPSASWSGVLSRGRT